MNQIQEKSYYIIKVETNGGCFYKIGEGHKISRPNKLVEKYSKLRANNATLLLFETLPHNNKKRLNDKTIHSKIDSSKMKKADSIYVEHYLKETDGKEEFFELVDKTLDVVEYIKSIVRSCTSKDYTAAVKEIINLDFKDRYHLVDNETIEKIEEKFPEVDDILFNHKEDNVLLIGQFEPDFVASFAMHNKVMIWHDTKEQRHLFNYSKLNNNITYFEGTLEEFIEETKDMKFNLIIANPPYDTVGASITQAIIDNIEFDEYINIEPANDYKLIPGLWNYQSDMITASEPGTSAFIDAAVTTHIAKIHKSKVNNMSKDEFEIHTYVDRSLDKYFTENYKRTHYAIDSAKTNTPIKIFDNLTPDTTFIQEAKDVNHKHLPYSKKTDSYRWNVLKNIDSQYIRKERECKAKGVPSGSTSLYTITFNTENEKLNFTNFIYSNLGFKFLSKLFTSINADSYVIVRKYYPKVDWTRSWTVEEILTDYGYTEDEIKEVMEDLKNFKGMDD